MTLWDKIISEIKKLPLFEGLKTTLWAWSITDDGINSITDCNVLMELYRAAPMWKMAKIYNRMRELNCPNLRAELKTVDNVVRTVENPSVVVGELMHEAMSNPVLREMAETTGAAVYDAIISMAVEGLPSMPSGLLERIRRFIGTITLLSAAPRMAGVLAEATTGGKVRNVGHILSEAYWNLGLGFVTWQMTSPLIQNAIGNRLDEAARRVYRPTRFTMPQVMELYAKGMVDGSYVLDALRNLGYRDEDIDKVIALSYRTFTEPQVQSMVNAGIMTAQEAVKHLRAAGYSADQINKLIQLWNWERLENRRTVALSTARSAFKKGIIGENRFRQILADLKYTPEAIDIEVALVKGEKQTEERDLTVSQIKEAYQKGVLGTPETRKQLLEMGYDAQEAAVLIETWSRTAEPKVLKLNKSSILEALHQGVIDEASARAKLRELGYTPADTDIIIRTYYAQTAVKPKALPLAQYMTAVRLGIISETTFRTKLTQAGYAPDDIDTALKLAQYQPHPTLTYSFVLAALTKGVITKGEALERLTAMGYSQDDALVMIATAEKTEEPEAKRLPATFLMQALGNGLISEERFAEKAKELGYTDEDIGLMIAMTRYEPPERIAAVAVLSAFRYGVIDRPTAKRYLTEGGMAEAEAELRLRTVEEITAREKPTPSLSALMAALSAGIISEAEFADRLRAMGYLPADIDIYIKMATTETPPKATELTKTEILACYKALLFTRGETLSRLVSKGYTVADAETLIKLQGLKPMDTVIHKLVLWGLMDVEKALEAFRRLGFPEPDVKEYAESMGVSL